ncbi:MAG: hypothetical protein LUF30_10630 [Lachnospiraceae bacterium]|nr:hypothetical protein [Lachnospiraceae bacterium]
MYNGTYDKRFENAVLENEILPEVEYNSDPFYSEQNLLYVEKSVKELRAGKGQVHELIEVTDENKE